MPSPLIGVTTYGRNEKGRVSLPMEYVDAVRRAGGVPVLLAPGEGRLKELLARLDGVILTGGGDVDPSLYGGKAHGQVYMVDRARDEMEVSLVKDAVKARRPLFGICRGSQIMNVALGGTLVEHLPDEVGEKILHRKAPGEHVLHEVSLLGKGRLEKALGRTSFTAASSHHQAVRRPAAALAVAARAADGTVEAVELPAHPWLVGVQWHPEITAAEDPLQQKLFNAFVAVAKKFRGR